METLEELQLELTQVRASIKHIYANMGVKELTIRTSRTETVVKSANFQSVLTALRQRETELLDRIAALTGDSVSSIIDTTKPVLAIPVVFGGNY